MKIMYKLTLENLEVGICPAEYEKYFSSYTKLKKFIQNEHGYGISKGTRCITSSNFKLIIEKIEVF